MMTKKPQANAICKHMHQTIGSSLYTMQVLTPPSRINMSHQLVNCAFANYFFATCSVIHSGL